MTGRQTQARGSLGETPSSISSCYKGKWVPRAGKKRVQVPGEGPCGGSSVESATTGREESIAHSANIVLPLSPVWARDGCGQGGSCLSQLVHLGAVLLSLPFFLIPGCSLHPGPTPCEDGGGKLGEALPTKLGCPENPQHVRLYAEHLIYCFICFHEDPHSTQEEVGAQRG